VAKTAAKGVFTVEPAGVAVEPEEQDPPRGTFARQSIRGPPQKLYRVWFRKVGSVESLGEVVVTDPGLFLTTKEVVAATVRSFAYPFFVRLESERPEADRKEDAKLAMRQRRVAMSSFVCAWRDWAQASNVERAALARERRSLGGAVSNEELEVYSAIAGWARLEQKRGNRYLGRKGGGALGCQAAEVRAVAACLELAVISLEHWWPRLVSDACSEDDRVAGLVQKAVLAIEAADNETDEHFSVQPNTEARPELLE
jgi:hypothetical protein